MLAAFLYAAAWCAALAFARRRAARRRPQLPDRVPMGFFPTRRGFAPTGPYRGPFTKPLPRPAPPREELI
jgi:hypothetical protein